MSDIENKEHKIAFLLKSMENKFVDDTMKKGRFCFNHPSAFNQWENKNVAQYDRWDAHSAYEVTYIVFAPIIDEKDGRPIYGQGRKLADSGVARTQYTNVKHSPICCFRRVEEGEFEPYGDFINFSLGETADRITKEFGHDSYILVNAAPFIERMQNHISLCGSVVYKDRLNDFQFNVDEKYRETIEQLFRKDEQFAWQKEFRFVLSPTKDSKVFVELGSIEDIAVCGKLSELR